MAPGVTSCSIDAAERELILEAFSDCGSWSQAAKLLQLSVGALPSKLRHVAEQEAATRDGRPFRTADLRSPQRAMPAEWRGRSQDCDPTIRCGFRACAID